MSTPLTAEVLVERYEALRRRVGPDVTIVAVTKTFGADVVALARDVGIVDLGENYAQELAAKAAEVEGVRWHMIGSVQRNKVKRLADTVHLWHAIDRGSIVDELVKRAPGAHLLVQVNTTGEATKAGCTVAEAPGLVERARAGGLDCRGLMTVGPVGDPAGSRAAFASLRRLAEALDLPELSMGMSGDLDEALAEGATIVRVGTALFGPRPVRA